MEKSVERGITVTMMTTDFVSVSPADVAVEEERGKRRGRRDQGEWRVRIHWTARFLKKSRADDLVDPDPAMR